MIKNISILFCLSFWAITFQVSGAPVSYYQGTVYSEPISRTQGVNFIMFSNENLHYLDQGLTSDGVIGLDTNTNEMWYEEFRYTTDTFTSTFTDEFTVGFGQVVDITTTITINSIQNGLTTPTERLDLVPTTGGEFDIEPTSTNPYGPQDVNRGPLELSGTYNIAGPTETATGAFSLVLDHNVYSHISYRTLDASLYPDSLTLSHLGEQTESAFLSGPENTYVPGTGLIYSGIIDGVDFKSSIDAAYFRVQKNMMLSPSAVPVPAAVWLFGSGLIGLISIARRKNS